MNPIPELHLDLASLIRDIERQLHATQHQKASETTFGDLSASLEKRIFRLAVLGPWNSGKSCLVNRLLGEEPENGLLPVADEPCSAKITQLSYGELPKVSKIWDDGRVEVLAENVNSSREALRVEAATKGEGILKVEWPAELLMSGGELLDTPGLFDPDEEKSVVTLEAMARFHGVIFVVPAHMPVDQSVLDFLKELLTRQTSSRFFYLINKIDRLTPEDGPIEEHISWCYEQIAARLDSDLQSDHFQAQNAPSSLIDRARFFAVSGRTGQGLDDVWSAVQKHLQHGAYSELVSVGVGRVEKVLSVLTAAFEAEEAATFANAKDLEEIVNEARIYRSTLDRQIAETSAGIKQDFESIIVKAQGRIQTLIDSLTREGGEKLAIGFWRKLTGASEIQKELSGLQRMLQERAQDEMERIERKLQSDIRDRIKYYNSNAIEGMSKSITRYAERLDVVLQAASSQAARDSKFKPLNFEEAEQGDCKFGDGTIANTLATAATAGAGIAYVTGAVGTTTTVASAVSWVPLWVAQAVGMTTTTTAVTVSGVGLALSLGGPITAAVLALIGIMNVRKACQAVETFESFLKSLQGKAPKIRGNIKSELHLMAEGLSDGMKTSLEDAHARLIEAGDGLVAAAQGRRSHDWGTDPVEKISEWIARNKAIKNQLNPQ